jgi:hypothetical protein
MLQQRSPSDEAKALRATGAANKRAQPNLGLYHFGVRAVGVESPTDEVRCGCAQSDTAK